jgi:hypothetical protein
MRRFTVVNWLFYFAVFEAVIVLKKRLSKGGSNDNEFKTAQYGVYGVLGCSLPDSGRDSLTLPRARVAGFRGL